MLRDRDGWMGRVVRQVEPDRGRAGRDRRWAVAGGVTAFVVTFALLLTSCSDSGDSIATDATADTAPDATAPAEDEVEDLADGVRFEGVLTGQVSLRSVDLQRGQALRVAVEPLESNVIGLEIHLTAAAGPLFDQASMNIDGFSDAFSDAGFDSGTDLFTDIEYGSFSDSSCNYGTTVGEAAFNLGYPLIDTENELPDGGIDQLLSEGYVLLGFGGTTSGGPTPAWLSFIAPADGTYNVVIKARDSGCADVTYGRFQVRMQSAEAPAVEAADEGDFDEGNFATPAEIAGRDELLDLLRFHREFLTDAEFFPTELLFSDLYGDDVFDQFSDSFSDGSAEGGADIEDLERVDPDPESYYGPPDN